MIKKLTEKSLITLITQIIQIFTSLLMIKIYSKNLEVVEFGAFIMMISFASNITGLYIGSLTQATFLNFQKFSNKIENKLYFDILRRSRNLRNIYIFILCFFASILLYYIDRKHYYVPIIIWVLIICESLKYTEEYIFYSQNNFLYVLYLNLIDLIFKGLFTFILFRFMYSSNFLIIPHIFSSISIFIYISILNKKKRASDVSILSITDKAIVRQFLFREEKSIYLSYIFANIFEIFLRNIFIFTYGVFYSGIFNIFYNLIKRPYGIVHHILTLNLLHYIKDGTKIALFHKVYINFKIIWLLVLCFFSGLLYVFLFFYSENIISLFLDIKYLEYVNNFNILAICISFFYIIMAYINFFIADSKYTTVPKIYIFYIINILLSFLYSPIFSINSRIFYGFLIASLIQCLLTVYLYHTRKNASNI